MASLNQVPPAQLAQGYREMHDSGLQFEPDGRVFKLANGQKTYIPPWLAWQYTSIGKDPQTGQLSDLGRSLRTPGSDPSSVWNFMYSAGGPFTNRSQWDDKKGTYQGSIDWLTLLTTIGATAIIGAGVAAAAGGGAAAPAAGGGGGGAAGGGAAVPVAGAAPAAGAGVPAAGLAGLPGGTAVPGAAAATSTGTGAGAGLAGTLMRYYPYANAALSAVGGAVSDTASQTTMPTLDPAYGPLQAQLLDLVTKRLSSGAPDLAGYTAGGMQNINRTYDLVKQSQDNSLAARGLASSPVAGAVDTRRDLARAGDLASFQNTIPLVGRQFENENLGLASQLLGFGRGQTSQLQRGGGWGGALQSLANVLAHHYGYAQG